MDEKNNKKIGLQESFLKEIVSNKELVEINLVNSLILKCKIISYDNFSILTNYNHNNALIYKHSISFILKSKKNKK